MQDADGPADVQTLPQPARHRRPRVQVKPVRFVPRSEDLHGIAANLRRARDLRQNLAVRAAEPKLAGGLSIELIAVLVDGTMMPAASPGGGGGHGGAPVGPGARW